MSKHIYLIEIGGKHRLVEANNKQVARNYVAERMMTVSLATQQELVELVGSGTKVESA